MYNKSVNMDFNWSKLQKKPPSLLSQRRGLLLIQCPTILVLQISLRHFIFRIHKKLTVDVSCPREDYSSVSLNPAILASSRIESLDTFLPLYSMRSSHCPVKISLGLYFLMMILSSSVKISKGSLSPISKLLISYIGNVILPNESSFLTIPVLCITYSSLVL